MIGNRLIEKDDFPFEFISQLAEQESLEKGDSSSHILCPQMVGKKIGFCIQGNTPGMFVIQGTGIEFLSFT